MSNNKSHPHDSKQGLLKSTSVLAGGTLASRILGFVRDVILAKFLGTGWQADAFFLAQRIPNLFRDLVGEGAANSAVVPVLSEYQAKKDPKEFWRLVNVISLWALIILSVITLAGMALAPWIVRVMAPGFKDDPATLELAIQLTRLIFPYLIFIGLTAHSMAVLYTFRSFVVPAFSPCLFNIAVIISAFLSVKFLNEPTYGLALGVLVGGVLQLGAQIPVMLKNGMMWQPGTLSHPGARQCGRLLAPRLFGSGVYQINLVIDTFCASLSGIVGPGGISAIYYANRLIQLPLGVFGFALAAAALPALSSMAARDEMDKFKHTVIFALENIFFVMFPISVAMILLADPLVRLLFERGQFDSYSTGITALALTFYSLGLFSFGGSKILTTSFYALKDTKTPVKVAVICLILTAVLNALLIWPMGIGGIALASSISSVTGFLLLFKKLKKKIGGMNEPLRPYVLKILGASLLAGAALKVVAESLDPVNIPDILKLLCSALTGIIIYLLICQFLKIQQLETILKSLKFKV